MGVKKFKTERQRIIGSLKDWTGMQKLLFRRQVFCVGDGRYLCSGLCKNELFVK